MKTAILAALVLSGCASITHGTKQDITFEAPPQQVCYITQGSTMIASIAETQTIKVGRSKEPITVDCGNEKKVYAAEINAAAYTSMMWIDFGLVDFATGAAWTYSEKQ
jgi:hypothetical protein